MRTRRLSPLLLLAGLLGLTAALPAGEAEKKAPPAPPQAAPAHLRIQDWSLAYDEEHERWEGSVTLQSRAPRLIEFLGLRVRVDDTQAQRLDRTDWFEHQDVAPGETVTSRFTLDAPRPFGLLWLHARYYWAPERGEGEALEGKEKVTDVLRKNIKTDVLDSLDERFFSLTEETPQRFSDEALDRAVAEYNRALGVTAEEPAAAARGELSFLELLEDEEKGELVLTYDNQLRALQAGALTVSLELKDAEGRTVRTLTQTVAEPVPVGRGSLRFDRPQDLAFRGWEVAYRY